MILENETLRLEFERATGALVGLTAAETGWDILSRPHLGLSFRLLVPLPDRRNNPVFGERQEAPSLEVTADRRRATFVWDGVNSEYGGMLDIGLALDIELTDRQVVYAVTISPC